MNELYTPLKLAFLMFLTLIASMILHLALSNGLRLANIAPNVLIITVSAAGFLLGKRVGMLTGLVAGLMMDVLSISLYGFNALVYMCIGYMCGNLKRLLFMDRFWVSLGIIGISDIVAGFCNYVFLFLLRGRMNLPYYAVRVVLAEGIYTVCIATFVFPLLKVWLLKLDNMITEYINSKR